MGKMINNDDQRLNEGSSGGGVTRFGSNYGGSQQQQGQDERGRDTGMSRGMFERGPLTGDSTQGQGRFDNDRQSQGQVHVDSDRQSQGRGRFDDRQGSFGSGPRGHFDRDRDAQRTPGDGRRRWRRTPQQACDIMTRNPKTVRSGDTLQQIAQIMVDEDTGIIPVVDGGKLVGVVTDRDIVCRALASGADMKTAKASDVMTDDVECVTERDSLDDVLRVMGEHQIRRVAVVAKDDRLVGIISMADLAREADVDERLQDTFEEISSERGFWSRMR